MVLINEAEAFCFAIYCAVIPRPQRTAELNQLSDIYMHHGAAQAPFTPSLYVNVMMHLLCYLFLARGKHLHCFRCQVNVWRPLLQERKVLSNLRVISLN